MYDIIIVALVFGSLTVCVLFVCLVLMMNMFRKKSISKVSGHEEALMVQEMYNGLNRMESRIEALETILLDREKNNHEQV
ncbi:MAG: envelope stress response membrane protein PspB [Chitinispirillaceae bacterium]|nr:envelope stress response membrane protein PspB [Chitinispirillaceae bacterium]